MEGRMNIIDVNAANVAEHGFFCQMSKKKSPGYQRKLAWLKARFAEGLKIKLLDLSQGGRGFIEYIPGQYAWRAVNADGFMFIHCLWVVGQSKGKGYAGRLLAECLADAKSQGMRGVAIIASNANWLVSKRIFIENGFGLVDRAAPAFELLVKEFRKGPAPSFPIDWDKRAKKFGSGLTILRTDQCPYLDTTVSNAEEIAASRGIESRVIEFNSAAEVRRRAPTPYGVFGLVLNGKLLAYHYLLKKDLIKILDRAK
jgi:hypothetical protein